MRGGRHELLETTGLVMAMAAAVWAADAWLSGEEARTRAALPQAVASALHQEPVADADVVISGFQFLHTPSEPLSRPGWELTASSAQLREGPQTAVLNDIRATFTPERPERRVMLAGDRGRLDLRRMNFDIVGAAQPVSVQLADQYRLTTNRLLWDNRAGLLTTDQPIQLTGGGLTVTGTGLRWSLADRTVSILHEVQMVLAP